jgi:hypothetical protein
MVMLGASGVVVISAASLMMARRQKRKALRALNDARPRRS